jgi:hypothetical protein
MREDVLGGHAGMACGVGSHLFGPGAARPGQRPSGHSRRGGR